MRRAAGVRVGLAALGGLALTGCGHQSVSGEVITYAYDWWLGPLLIGMGLMALGAGIQLLREGKPWFAWAVMVVGPLAALALAPGAFLNRVVISPEGFEVQYGFWWDPEYHHVRFDEVRDLRIVQRVIRRPRGNSYRSDLHYTLKSGRHGVIPLDGDLRREAGPDILEAARKHGVAVAP